MKILECTGLSRHYGTGGERVKALDGISLSLEQGSFTAITGPSGSEKSTLLHVLGGLDRPTAGKVLFPGKGPVPAQRQSAVHSAATAVRLRVSEL